MRKRWLWPALLLCSAAVAQPIADSLLRDAAAAVQPDELHATIEKLVGFGTRHTLSDTASDTRGIGAARRWVQSRFGSPRLARRRHHELHERCTRRQRRWLRRRRGHRGRARAEQVPLARERRDVTADARELRLLNTVIDDWFFGVSALSADGFASPVVFPGDAGSF